MALNTSKRPPTSSKTEASKAEARVGKNADIIGRWDGKVIISKTAKLGQMTERDLKKSPLFLELRSDSTFLLNLLLPIKGTYTRNDRNITLSAKTMGGMTRAEQAEWDKFKGKATRFPGPLKGTIRATDVSFSFRSGCTLVFKRAVPEKPVATTVKPDEKPFVGRWRGDIYMRPSPSATEEEKHFARMYPKMLKEDSRDLTLRADNTFRLRMIVEHEGRWSVKRGKVVLMIDGGIFNDSITSEPFELTVSEGGKTLSAFNEVDVKNAWMTFRRV